VEGRRSGRRPSTVHDFSVDAPVRLGETGGLRVSDGETLAAVGDLEMVEEPAHCAGEDAPLACSALIL